MTVIMLPGKEVIMSRTINTAVMFIFFQRVVMIEDLDYFCVAHNDQKTYKHWYHILLFTEEEDDEEEDPGEAALDGAVMQDLDNVTLPMGSRGRAKFLHFCDNRRPAYWGTWSKKSVAVSGRRPFAKDVSSVLYVGVCA